MPVPSIDFVKFPKMARLSREMIVTEKIDGTNAQIFIPEDDPTQIFAGSRKRWITPEDDNYGFAKWVEENREELLKLGPGHHFGEWWGQGIQRGYGLKEKRFSLFNVGRWHPECGKEAENRPSCCQVIPIIYQGAFNTVVAEGMMEILKDHGSFASPGFMNPEGIVVFHVAGNVGFKKTFEKDDTGKWDNS